MAGGLFIDEKALPDTPFGFLQLVFLLLVYGFILFKASNLISDGSELLLLVPALASVVGSLVLPILGAVPDAAIVLFSGIGPNAQEELSVGVGALAGSTIMLLTVPWFMSVVAGRVTIEEDMHLRYTHKNKLTEETKWSLTEAGVSVGEPIRNTARLMLLTAISYVVIQGGAFSVAKVSDSVKAADTESKFALAAMMLCFFFFAIYLWYQWQQGKSVDDELEEEPSFFENKVDEVRKKNIAGGKVSLTALVYDDILPYKDVITAGYEAKYQMSFEDKLEQIRSMRGSIPDKRVSIADKGDQRRLLSEETQLLQTKQPTYIKFREDSITSEMPTKVGVRASTTELECLPPKILKRLKNVLRGFFHKYDEDGSGSIDRRELSNLLRDLNEAGSGAKNIEDIFTAFDTDKDGTISFEEFISGMVQWVLQNGGKEGTERAKSKSVVQDLDEVEDEENEEMPEFLENLDPKAQQAAILNRSFLMMGIGTFVVLFFSDPMVGVLSELGVRTGVPPFYVAFVLAPLASNASEVIASYNYSLKKTSKSMDVSLSALLGAACMNNSFCLAVFMVLIFAQDLFWEFTAETVAIIFVELAMFLACLKSVHTVLDATLILSLYPISLGIVAFLEHFGVN